ncbi:hypothetical protein PoB_001433100 [Plakobranchus ocellatus]|uniref:Uncharacterized protein n=1 Tax=Plakobranchus ocellatus TaxID=259542 RepID=A0AAV3YWG5_9GAST|nr:hypothetical protein PoB_001433100 [Plakobranchus ocellatus]
MIVKRLADDLTIHSQAPCPLSHHICTSAKSIGPLLTVKPHVDFLHHPPLYSRIMPVVPSPIVKIMSVALPFTVKHPNVCSTVYSQAPYRLPYRSFSSILPFAPRLTI